MNRADLIADLETMAANLREWNADTVDTPAVDRVFADLETFVTDNFDTVADL